MQDPKRGHHFVAHGAAKTLLDVAKSLRTMSVPKKERDLLISGLETVAAKLADVCVRTLPISSVNGPDVQSAAFGVACKRVKKDFEQLRSAIEDWHLLFEFEDEAAEEMQQFAAGLRPPILKALIDARQDALFSTRLFCERTIDERVAKHYGYGSKSYLEASEALNSALTELTRMLGHFAPL
jgi:hypothetical protein